MLDPQVHAECLEFIRAALADGDAELAQQVARFALTATPAGRQSGVTYPQTSKSGSGRCWPLPPLGEVRVWSLAVCIP